MQMPLAIVPQLPGFLLLVRHARLKQFHIAFSDAAPLSRPTAASSRPLFIKVSCQIFTLITYAYCMSCCFHAGVASHRGCRAGVGDKSRFPCNPGPVHLSQAQSAVSLHVFIYPLRRVTASYENTLDSQERCFIVMLKLIHPGPAIARRYERGGALYRLCSLNFHRLSRFPGPSPPHDRQHFRRTCNL